MIDAFATSLNHQLPLYYSPVPDQHAVAVYAMSSSLPPHQWYTNQGQGCTRKHTSNAVTRTYAIVI